ncbi:V-set and immunoglobulin domain-containing protein 10 isoform X2 [Kryptolebias marmoratus]|uniref:V-set and immunoglobulin domain-containing protein 10 isoform X2 n=1 Tax=Kryptolebias marmoratus TaxID=37003 RepID=UPI0007F907C3|nr:V-set and immunoglobulin domain-containing protein 10 isoform X2 [Kryptolebias marmoratus]
MNIVATAALLQLCFSATASVSDNDPTETLVTAEPGDAVVLPCYTGGNGTPSLTMWTKDGREVGGARDAGARVSVHQDGSLKFREAVSEDRGSYLCSSTLPDGTVFRARALLQITNVPDTHPDCMWVQTQDLSRIQLNCSWFGAYPPPKLRWGEAGDFLESDNLSVVLNGSRVTDGQKLKCTATHQLLKSGLEKSCLLTLKAPFPEGDPLAAAIEGTSVTLTCTETTAAPPANTTWTKGLQKSRIETGSKYVLSDEGPSYKLTILNVTKDDEGCFFCLSENQLGVKVLEVCLTVKTSSSAYTGGIIGVFIAALIVGSAVVVAKLLYSRRHEICLGGGFGDEDTGDVLSLVDSDDEQIFQDTVPQLPPVVNGRHLTLVEVHRIPSSDHDETEPADRSPQQPEDTEEPE